MLVVNGFGWEVPGRTGDNFRQNPKLSLTQRGDFRPRRPDEVVLGVVFHTRLGLRGEVRPGRGPNRGWDLDLAARFSKDDRAASCHVAVDADGSYACFADLARVATYHAGHVNGITVGIELYQEADGAVYEETLESGADICDVVTRVFGVQRQVPVERAICRRFANILPTDAKTYIAGGNRGRDFSGVYGHRNITRNRGEGDPGDRIFELLVERGYERYAVDAGEDIAVWEQRQRELNMDPREVDGVPGQVTRSMIAMHRKGGPGIWVEREGDETFHTVG
jgi:hypothetical protein